MKIKQMLCKETMLLVTDQGELKKKGCGGGGVQRKKTPLLLKKVGGGEVLNGDGLFLKLILSKSLEW